MKDARKRLQELLRKALLSLAAICFLAGSASAQTLITLPDNWQFSPDGGVANARFVEKLILTGWSHVDGNLAAGTFTETGILQVGSYIDPATGLEKPISDITNKDVYVSWEGLAGTQVQAGTEVTIFFNHGGIIRMFVDPLPSGSLKINDSAILAVNDADSFKNLSNGLTPIATFAVITSALNTDTNQTEFTGGSFDLNVAGPGGVGEFTIWTEMDAQAGHFYDKHGIDLDTLDSDIAADGTVISSGGLQARASMDAQQDPFTFHDATSTAPPGRIDDADPSQEDNYEDAIAAIHGVGTPDLRQTFTTVGETVLLEDFFAFHRGDFDLQAAEEEEQPGSCRVTGGGVDVNGEIVLGSLAKAQDTDDRDRYQFGGQVGAPTASPPQPFGEWTHHQQKGPSGSFILHMGTHSAPPITEIAFVQCSDPGFCNPARPAPFKQIDFEGIGTFKNVKGSLKSIVVPDNKPNFTAHWVKVHIEDIGEAGPGGKQPKSDACTHIPGTAIDESQDCSNCPDVYQIEIHASADPASPVIYSVGAFIDAGNLQIHPEIK